MIKNIYNADEFSKEKQRGIIKTEKYFYTKAGYTDDLS